VPVPFLKLVINNARNPPDDPPRVTDSRVDDLPQRPRRREECGGTDQCPRCGGLVHFAQDAEGDLSCPECRAEVAYHARSDTWVTYDPRAPEAEQASNSSLLPPSVFHRCRPCVYVSCPHNNYLNLNPSSGKIKLTRPQLDPWSVEPHDSCSLDVADQGSQTLERVGDILNLTRERTRQIEQAAVIRLRVILAKHLSRLETELDLSELIASSVGLPARGWPRYPTRPYRRDR